MTRRLTALALAVGAATVAEPLLGVHGHWPVGLSGALGLAGSLLLVLSAKALGHAGLQRPDPAAPEEPGP